MGVVKRVKEGVTLGQVQRETTAVDSRVSKQKHPTWPPFI